jgi:hypothetical protein
MSECRNCGAHVSENFARVYGDNSGRVHACIACVPKAHLKYAASGRERPHTHEAVADGGGRGV